MPYPKNLINDRENVASSLRYLRQAKRAGRRILVVEYLVEKHGIETLKKILDDLGKGITINDALARHTGS